MQKTLAEQLGQQKFDPQNMEDPAAREFYKRNLGEVIWFEAIIACFTFQPDTYQGTQMLLKNITQSGKQVADHTWVSIPASLVGRIVKQGNRIRIKAKPYEYKAGRYGLWLQYAEVIETVATQLQGESLPPTKLQARESEAQQQQESSSALDLVTRSLEWFKRVMMSPLKDLGLDDVPDEFEMPVRRILVAATRGKHENLFAAKVTSSQEKDRMVAYLRKTFNADTHVSESFESMETDLTHYMISVTLKQ